MVQWLSHIPKYSDDCFSVDYLENTAFSGKLLSCGINIPTPETDILLEKKESGMKAKGFQCFMDENHIMTMAVLEHQQRPEPSRKAALLHCTEGEVALPEMLRGPGSSYLPGLTTSSSSSRPPAASLCISLPGSFSHNWGKSGVPGNT